MQRNQSELMGNWEYEIKRFLNDEAFWKQQTKGGASFPNTIVAMQNITNNYPIEAWRFQFPTLLPTDIDPKKASVFNKRKEATRMFYSAISKSCQGTETNFQAVVECIDYLRLNYFERKTSSLEKAATVGFILGGL